MAIRGGGCARLAAMLRTLPMSAIMARSMLVATMSTMLLMVFVPLVGWIFLILNFKSSNLPPLEGRWPDGRRGEMNRFNQYKVFDISKSRPQVLLLGNGLFRNKDNPSWTELILKLANLENSSMEDKLFFSQIKNDAPYSILAGSVLPDDRM